MCGAVGTNIDKTAFAWSCVDIQLVRGLNYINSLIGCMVTNTSSGYTGCISTLEWITAKNPLTTSWMYSTPDPNVKWIHSSSELWVWISGPEAVIIHRFPPNTCCRCLKKARLCFWDENPKLHWRKKKTPWHGMPGPRPVSFPTNVTQLDSKASLSSQRSRVFARGQCAESEQSWGVRWWCSCTI